MVAAKKGGLGKGLGALFADMDIGPAEVRIPNEKEGTEGADGRGLVYLDVHLLTPNSRQPRKHFDEEKIQELASSIEVHGILQPIMVRKTEQGFEIVAGERRWRAARKAGLNKVPCLVRELTEEQNMLVAIIENMQREDLNPMEEARAIADMIDSFGLTQEEVSRSVGKSRPYIANSLRLLKLPARVQELVAEGKLSSGHGRTLLAVEDGTRQQELAQYAVREGVSVRELEKLVQEKAGRKKPLKRRKAVEVASLENELRSIFGTKVEIKLNGNKGRLEIQCFNREELERIVELLRSLA